MRMLMLYVCGVFYVCTVLCVSFLVHGIVDASANMHKLFLAWDLATKASRQFTQAVQHRTMLQTATETGSNEQAVQHCFLSKLEAPPGLGFEL